MRLPSTVFCYVLLVVTLLLSALSGGLLFIADYPVHAVLIQLAALLPFLYAVRRCSSWQHATVAGTSLGFAYAVLLGFALRFLHLPIFAVVGLGVYFALFFVTFALAVFTLWKRGPVLGSLAIAVVMVVLEIVDSHLPMWGTAQSFAHVWSTYPSAIRFISLTGTPGVAFIIVASQALLFAAVVDRSTKATWVFLGVVTVPIVFAFAPRPPTRSLRVAAMGWSEPSGPSSYERLLVEASEKGARLVVSPEVAFDVPADGRPEFEHRFSNLAKQHEVYLAVSYFDHLHDDVRLAFFAPTGQVVGEYVKMHLVPLSENHRAGSGQLVFVDIDGVRVGAMICQDDNFTDIARHYKRAGAQLVVVPNYEWPEEVAPYHFENSLLRPIEFGYGLVRAAANGTSAIVSAGGKIVARTNHNDVGASVIVADVEYPAP